MIKTRWKPRSQNYSSSHETLTGAGEAFLRNFWSWKLNRISISARRQKVSPDFAKIFAICHHLSLSGNLTLPSSTTFDHFIESAKIKQNSDPRSGNGAIVLQYFSLALFIAPFLHFLCFLFLFHVSCQLFYFLRPISIISFLSDPSSIIGNACQ